MLANTTMNARNNADLALSDYIVKDSLFNSQTFSSSNRCVFTILFLGVPLDPPHPPPPSTVAVVPVISASHFQVQTKKMAPAFTSLLTKR